MVLCSSHRYSKCTERNETVFTFFVQREATRLRGELEGDLADFVCNYTASRLRYCFKISNAMRQ
jgi:hypothetical protein